MNNVDTANYVTTWTSLGAKLPKELAKAIEVFEAVKWTEVGHTPRFDVEKVTAANAEAKIREFADQLSTTRQSFTRGALPESLLDIAKREALEAAARLVTAYAGHAIPDLIEQISPRFVEYADAYADAIALLPEELTSESLVAYGPPAVAAYDTACGHVARLNVFSSWVGGTSQLPSVSAKVEPVLHILRPHTAAQLARLEEASWKQSQADTVLRALNPVLVAAVRHGVEFKINTLRECAEIRSSLQPSSKTFIHRVGQSA